MTVFSTEQWFILGLTFLLGLLVGAWMTSGGRRKWKTRYNNEVTERKALEAKLKERESHFAAREKEWRDQDARREAALRSAPAAGRSEPFVEDRVRDRHPGDHRDLDRDGVPDRQDARPLDPRR
jgi:hypothetical protein